MWQNKMLNYLFFSKWAFLTLQICKLCYFRDPRMTFEGIWSKQYWGTNFGIFDPRNGHLTTTTPPYPLPICKCFTNFGHGRPANDIWGHLEQTIVLQMLAFLIRKIGTLTLQYANYPNLGHGRPTNDFQGHLGQNGSVPPATL